MLPTEGHLYIFHGKVGKSIVDGDLVYGVASGARIQMKARVVLYTKPGCGLCEEMKEQMALADCAELYALEEVDIEKDAELFALYRYEIPVLCINGVEAFRYRLRANEFRAYVTSL